MKEYGECWSIQDDVCCVMFGPDGWFAPKRDKLFVYTDEEEAKLAFIKAKATNPGAKLEHHKRKEHG